MVRNEVLKQDMSDKAAEAAARLEQWKNAPLKAKRVTRFAALLGFIVLLRFLAAAYAGHLGWGRAVFYGINNDKGDLSVIICFNNDIGDFWEWIDQPQYALKPSAEGLKLGINFVLYAMTH